MSVSDFKSKKRKLLKLWKLKSISPLRKIEDFLRNETSFLVKCEKSRKIRCDFKRINQGTQNFRLDLQFFWNECKNVCSFRASQHWVHLIFTPSNSRAWFGIGKIFFRLPLAGSFESHLFVGFSWEFLHSIAVNSKFFMCLKLKSFYFHRKDADEKSSLAEQFKLFILHFGNLFAKKALGSTC